METRAMVGLVLGYGALGIFLLFTIIKIIIDERKRHTRYATEVKNAYNTLMTRLDQTDEDIDKLNREFVEQEKRGGKPKEEDDDAALINWA